MKILNLIKCEFIKNYNIKKFIFVTLTLIISIIAITEFNLLFYKKTPYNIDRELEYVNFQYDIYINNNTTKSLKDEYEGQMLKNRIDMLEQMKSIGGLTQNSWQYSVLFDIFKLKNEIVVINQIIDNPNEKSFIDIFNSQETMFGVYEGDIKENYTNDIQLLNNKLLEKVQLISQKQKLIEENKYYKYIEYLLANNQISSDIDYYKSIVDKKIESPDDFRIINISQKVQLTSNFSYPILTEDEYNNSLYREDFNNYYDYLRYAKYYKKSTEEKVEIINYSIKNDIKHDIYFNIIDNIDTGDFRYITAKVPSNQILNLSIVVIILVIFTAGGIISNEHMKGTDKMLFTSPIKRWKIIFSKFIYMILQLYIIWIFAFILLLIYSGLKYGLNELITPKLIYSNGVVVEVNYILYTLKQILISSIPIISFFSIIFLISTITLNTQLTIGIASILTIISPLMWYFIYTYNLKLLAYTPLPYFNFGLIINNHEYFVSSLKIVNVNYYTGLIICTITTIICYIISNLIYTKRDIKN